MKTAKRQYGEGNIREYSTTKGVRLQVQWWEPVDPHFPEGPKRRQTKAGFVTKKSAADFLRERRTEVAKGQRTTGTSDGPAYATFFTEWISGHRGAESTLAAYRRLFRLHIEPTLGHRGLMKIRPTTLAALYRDLEATGRQEAGHVGEGLGPSTVRKVHDLISVSLQAALDDGLIIVNPAKHPAAKPPRPRDVKAAKPEMEVWNAKALSAFLEWSVRNDRGYFTAWCFAAHTGVRRGEVLGLRWGDIDLVAGKVTIRRSLTAVKEKGKPGRVVLGPTKNGKNRTIPLTPDLAAALRRLKAKMAERGLAHVAKDAVVFTLRNGNYLHPDQISKRWAIEVGRFCDTYPGADEIKFHGLRHTHATLLLMAGEQAKVVQERLGHETISITLDTYAHVLDGQQQGATDTFSALLRGAV